MISFIQEITHKCSFDLLRMMNSSQTFSSFFEPQVYTIEFFAALRSRNPNMLTTTRVEFIFFNLLSSSGKCKIYNIYKYNLCKLKMHIL